jgi:hypothetical protein
VDCQFERGEPASGAGHYLSLARQLVREPNEHRCSDQMIVMARLLAFIEFGSRIQSELIAVADLLTDIQTVMSEARESPNTEPAQSAR